MSEVKVNKISPRTNCGTVQLGDSGDTITIPSGATITNAGTAAGFGSTGEVSWNTTKVTTGFTAASGVGYFADTSSSAFTITLPASPSAGNVIAVSDYAGTFGTNGLTIGRNSSNINGSASNFTLGQNNVTAQFIYVDATQGWRVVFTGSQTGEGLQQAFICATGGTITNSGSCRIHTFTGPGTFTVNSLADTPANNKVSYMVVAGGGGGGGARGGGGGAGGFREGRNNPITPYTASPLAASCSGITVTASAFPITVGGGGAGEATPQPGRGAKGSNSVFSTITSAGGGSGRNDDVPLSTPSDSGGSGAGAGGGANPVNTKGEGNTPPVSPSQGNPGADSITGNAPPANPGGGGGGATAPGKGPGPGGTPSSTADGGAGATTCISGSPVAYAGGGGGGGPGVQGSGGTGGGGDSGNPSGGTGANGTTNRGGGGGGGSNHPFGGGTGGSGIVIIRYKVS